MTGDEIREQAAKAAETMGRFVVPFTKVAVKLRNAKVAGTGCTLEAKEVVALIEALQLLRDGQKRQT